MSNQDDQTTQLLAGTYHGDWSTGPAGNLARAAAAYARRRQRTRRTLAGLGAGAAALAVISMTLRSRPNENSASALAAPPPVNRSYEIISDDELLEQLRDRPVLVVRNGNGTREIILLANE